MDLSVAIEEILAELETLNPKCKNFVAMFRAAKTGDHLLIAKSLDIIDKNEEVLAQKLVDLLEPIAFSGSEVEKVRMEMEAMEAAGHEIRNPQEEEEWEKKLKEARDTDFEKAEKIKADRLAGNVPMPSEEVDQAPTAMTDIKGLGDSSIEKLKDSGINTPAEFHALSHEQRITILGPLVAAKFKPAQE